MIDWKAAIPAAVLGVAGAWLGTYLSSLIDGYWLSKLFGGLLLIMGVMQLFYKKRKRAGILPAVKRSLFQLSPTRRINSFPASDML